jgi:hypothetical protein
MKYKVTIISNNETEKPEVLENLSQNDFFILLVKNRDKKILIEPMPEKIKVLVWFYVCKNKFGTTYSASNIDLNNITQWLNNDIRLGNKVSEIKNIEVEM